MCVFGSDMNENQGKSVKVGSPGAQCPQYVSGSSSTAASIKIKVFNGLLQLFSLAAFMICVPLFPVPG